MGSYQEMAEGAIESGSAENLTPHQMKLTEGERLIGEYVSREEKESKKEDLPDFYVYDFLTDEGPVNALFTQHFDQNMGEVLESGVVYMITYKEKIKLDKTRSFVRYEVLRIGKPEE